MLIQPVRQLGRILGNIGKAFVPVGRIEEIFREEAEELFLTQAKPEIKGDIVFDSVSFAYPGTGNTPVLDTRPSKTKTSIRR